MQRSRSIIVGASFIIIISFTQVFPPSIAYATVATTFDSFQARPPIHAFMGASSVPQGLSPADIKAAYHLPTTGGSGTIAIISAFHHPSVESDLASFTKAFNIASCTIKNKCLEIHSMTSSLKTDSGWDLETALDTEWSHAIAPKAKILVVEAARDDGPDLLRAVDFAASRSDVVSVSMSWGGGEFIGETKLDSHFSISAKNNNIPVFFASSGDDGAGVSWPASSANVVSVGGTSLMLKKSLEKSGKVITSVASEKAWSGSGGGVSAYESQPLYQSDYSISRSVGMRAVPDISYEADPMYGFSVYHLASAGSASGTNGKHWYIIGGTSAGAPQWAAINALGKSVSLSALYRDKAATNNTAYFRDITSGKNGTCAYFCTARKRYDYVTGLGSPLTWKF
jgi:subtilase family serine protease